MGRIAALLLALLVAVTVTVAPLTAQAQPPSRMEQFLRNTETAAQQVGFVAVLIPGAQKGAAVLLGISLVAGALRVALYSNDTVVDSLALVADNATPAPIRHVTRPLVEEIAGGLLSELIQGNGRRVLDGFNTPRQASTSFNPNQCTPMNPDGRPSFTATPSTVRPASGAGFMRP